MVNVKVGDTKTKIKYFSPCLRKNSTPSEKHLHLLCFCPLPLSRLNRLTYYVTSPRTLSVRDYHLISSILKRRYTSHTRVCHRYLPQGCQPHIEIFGEIIIINICGILVSAADICGILMYAADIWAYSVCLSHLSLFKRLRHTHSAGAY